MFKMFSWGQFAGLLAVLLVVYYAYVVAVYYRVELQALLKGKAGKKAKGAPALGPVLAGRSALLGSVAPLVSAEPAPAAKEEDSTEEEGSLQEDELDDHYNDDVIIESEEHNNIITFTRPVDAPVSPGPNDQAESEQEEFQPDFLVGVAQLTDYFEAAGEGRITQAQLVEEVPELENTDLLAAFFRGKTQAAQALTSHYFVGVAEPALD